MGNLPLPFTLAKEIRNKQRVLFHYEGSVAFDEIKHTCRLSPLAVERSILAASVP